MVAQHDRERGGHAETGGESVTRTLWIVAKDGHTMRCMISGEAGHEELQVFFDREVYLSEIHTVHDGAVGRARTLHLGFEAHGWTVVFEAAASAPDPPTAS
jgi:hypothetical protein